MDKKDVILLLLNNGMIRGKTMMQGQVFLAYTEIFKEEMPGTDIENEITDLIKEGKIARYNRGEGHATYLITDKGVEYVNRIMQNISFKNLVGLRYKKAGWDDWVTGGMPLDIDNKALAKLRNNKLDWDEWNTQGISLYISRNYPEYPEISEKYRWKFEKCRCGHDYSLHRESGGNGTQCMSICECKKYDADTRFNALVALLKEKNSMMADLLVHSSRDSLNSILVLLDGMQDEIAAFTMEELE